MAITNSTIQGKVGNAIFYRVGRTSRVRSMPAGYLDANTSHQQENRSRLRVATRFYQCLVETVLRDAWKVAVGESGVNGFNFFMKVNMMVFRPDGKIGDFSRLQLAVGMMQKVDHLSAMVGDDDTVTLTWENGPNLPSARVDDSLVVVVLYGNRSFTPVFVEIDGATRGDGKATFRLERKRGTAAHLYSFFREKEGKAYSGSQYIRI